MKLSRPMEQAQNSLRSRAVVARGRRAARSKLRLLNATLALIGRDGLASLTTARVAKRAGFAQSTFYEHFRGLDDCLAEAGRELAQRLRPARPELRAQALEIFGDEPHRWPERLPDVVALFVRAAMGPFLAEPELTKLCYRHQRDPSPFGRAMGEVLERERSELTSVWWALAERAGALPEHYPFVALQAQFAFSATRGAIVALVYEQFSDRELVIQQLCAFLTAAIHDHMRQLDLRDAPQL